MSYGMAGAVGSRVTMGVSHSRWQRAESNLRLNFIPLSTNARG